DAAQVVAAAQPAPAGGTPAMLPPFISLELTPRRALAGPITAHGHLTFDRPDLDLDVARRLFDEIAEPAAGGDVCVLLGGPCGGDAMLHPQWEAIVRAAHDAGVTSIGIDTDLLGDTAAVD